jgi:hypothetical protein
MLGSKRVGSGQVLASDRGILDIAQYELRPRERLFPFHVVLVSKDPPDLTP